MSFSDRRALETLPARIEALQTQIAGLNAILADPDLFSRDPGRFTATTQALAAAGDELVAVEEQWPQSGVRPIRQENKLLIATAFSPVR